MVCAPVPIESRGSECEVVPGTESSAVACPMVAGFTSRIDDPLQTTPIGITAAILHAAMTGVGLKGVDCFK